jgi:RNA polymerase sigma-70 factor (ECF subfamily)
MRSPKAQRLTPNAHQQIMPGGDRAKNRRHAGEAAPASGAEASALAARSPAAAPGAAEAQARPAAMEDEDRGLTFEELVDKYQKKIYNLILRSINDPEEAADLTQETFLNACRSFHSFRGECKIHTWLCQIAINQCKNRFRQRDRRRAVEGPSLDAIHAGSEDANHKLEIADWSQSPQEELLKKETYRYVLKAIAQLDPQYRQVVTLCDLQQLSYQDIARITGLSLEAVKTRIHRGRLMLRRKLEAYLKS